VTQVRAGENETRDDIADDADADDDWYGDQVHHVNELSEFHVARLVVTVRRRRRVPRRHVVVECFHRRHCRHGHGKDGVGLIESRS